MVELLVFCFVYLHLKKYHTIIKTQENDESRYRSENL